MLAAISLYPCHCIKVFPSFTFEFHFTLAGTIVSLNIKAISEFLEWFCNVFFEIVPIQDTVKLLIALAVNPSSFKTTQRHAKVGFDSILALSPASWETMDEFLSPHISGS